MWGQGAKLDEGAAEADGGARLRLRDLYRSAPRIRAVIDADLQEADLIGAWAILAIALAVGGISLLSPNAVTAIGTFPILVVVGLFVSSAALRLWLAYRGPLKPWAVALFIVLDFAALYLLIWSYHLEYRQPPGFSLKAPTLFFVFLLIALRALRLEPLSVLGSGAAAIAGWAFLTWYAVAYAPPDGVTRDFISYATSSQVLVGAEIEKIIAILFVTLLLAIAIVRARRQLLKAAEGAAARQNLSQFFAPEIAARISAEETDLKPGAGEFRRGAILVCDLRGFTSLMARYPADIVMGLLVDYQERMSRVIRQHGGAIDKYLGDGILATFGCAAPSASAIPDALRALEALIAAGEIFETRSSAILGEPVRIGLALAGGRILCGIVGDAERLEFTVMGGPVNLASKLEKMNKVIGTIAAADADVLDEAYRDGLVLERREDLRIVSLDLPGLPEPCSVAGWRRREGD